MIVEEGKEIQKVEEVEESRAEIAAFFDLDGTLVAGPSMEKRLLRELHRNRMIGWKNYLLWLAQALQLAPRGITAIWQGNKMYLCGVAAVERERDLGGEMKLTFFAPAIERIAWHVKRGHTIVILSGTLEFLARGAAGELKMILRRRGIAAKIHVCATRLEESSGRWTGQVVGEAMFGEAKARAVRRLAAQMGFDLKRSYAYGDSLQDRWLLDAVGNPWVVNPSAELSRVAWEKNWPVVWWNEAEDLTQRAQRAQRTQRRAEAIKRTGNAG